MTATKITIEQLKEEMRAGKGTAEISRKYSVDQSIVRRKKARLAKQGWSPEHDLNHEIPDGYTLKGTSTLYNDRGQITAQWVKTDQDKQTQTKELTEYIHDLIKELPIYPIFECSTRIKYEDTLTVYPLGDPHIGMLAWSKECGDNWDLKIAESTFTNMFDIIMQKTPPSKVALLEILGDTLHYDNLAGITARSGNVLDVDGRYPQMIKVCTNLILNMINSLLRYHEKVVIDIVRGNHDDIGSIWLAELLLRVYQENPRVEVLDQHGPIHILEFGKVLIASHHGHTMKMDQLPITIASDYPEIWGRTKHRYCLTGHIHHDSRLKREGQEFTGMYVESFRTLASKDSFATWGGWRSQRDTKAIVYHKDLGEIERYTASVDALLLQVTDK